MFLLVFFLMSMLSMLNYCWWLFYIPLRMTFSRSGKEKGQTHHIFVTKFPGKQQNSQSPLSKIPLQLFVEKVIKLAYFQLFSLQEKGNCSNRDQTHVTKQQCLSHDQTPGTQLFLVLVVLAKNFCNYVNQLLCYCLILFS